MAGLLKLAQYVLMFTNKYERRFLTLQDFVQNLFELFDTENRGFISIQELIGGLRLLMV